MKKNVIAMGVLGLFAGAGTLAQAAFTVDTSGLTSASAIVTSDVSLAVAPKNVSDNAVTTEVSFPASNGASNLLASQYLELTYASNQGTWGVNVWTDYSNAAPPVSENLGGLHKDFTDNETLVPLGWQAFNSVADHDGAPADQTGAPAALDDADWTFIKSKKDSNWAAQQNGYAKVLTGVGPNQALIASGPGAGGQVTSPVYVYMSGYFGSRSVPAGAYSATLGFDLYHE